MGSALLQLPSLDFEPLYFRPHGAGDWSGHVPFAYDLVAALQPSLIVELGTQYGESYFTFCQAVMDCGVACKSFAVDTWRGDPHTGAYGEAVFREVSTHNQQHYATFSTLLRTFFDEALNRFLDGSIDLLHIDGLHTYEAVRHDFEMWFPKVSPGGIVLVHDTQVRRDDFGVWRLWNELRTSYQSFEFPHSCGLGVIRKPGGRSATSGLTALLFQNAEQAGAVRRFYLICGERLEHKDRAERQQRTGVWELLAKLYWRAAGAEFSEERSIYSRGEVSANRNGTRLELPPGASFSQLRIDLLESPLFMRIHSVRLFGPKDELLWSLPEGDARDNLECVGLRFTPDGDHGSVAARLAGKPATLLPSIPQPALDRLTSGGSVQLEISGLDAGEYTGALDSMSRQFLDRAFAAESALTASQSESLALGRSLAEAQDLVSKQQVDLRRYDGALSEAQKLVLDREAEVVALSRGLAEAQSLVRQQQADLARYDSALSEAQKLVLEREALVIALSSGLAEAQKLVLEREALVAASGRERDEALDLVRQQQADLSTYDRALSEAQKLALEREAEWRELDNRYREATDSLNRTGRDLADREARILHLTEVLAQTRKELGGREEQLCASAATLSEARRQAVLLEQAVSQARAESLRSSTALLELERLHGECLKRLQQIETSLTWRLTRPLRRLHWF